MVLIVAKKFHVKEESVYAESHISHLYSVKVSFGGSWHHSKLNLHSIWNGLKKNPEKKTETKTNEGQWEQNFGICILHRYNFTNKCTTITSSINSWYETVRSQLRMLVGEGWVGFFFHLFLLWQYGGVVSGGGGQILLYEEYSYSSALRRPKSIQPK